MQPSVDPAHDLASTLPFWREPITARFTREPPDADDTVPVAMCLTVRTNLVALDRPPARRPGHRQPRLSLVIAMLCGTFALGVVIGFLMV